MPSLGAGSSRCVRLCCTGSSSNTDTYSYTDTNTNTNTNTNPISATR